MYDVAVIGAGPVGSRIARNMAEKGFSTVVLEKKKHLAEPVCCTGIVGHECIDRFGIDPALIYRDANSASIFSPSGNLLRVERDNPQASILDRPALNEYLGGLAMDAGAEYILGSRVTKIEDTGSSVLLEVGTGDVSDRFEARVAVIADGFGSKLTEMAGLGKAGDFAMGAQAEVEAENLTEVEVFLGSGIAPGFFGWLVPTLPGKALAGLITRDHTAGRMKRFLSRLAEQGKIADGQADIGYAGVRLRNSPRTSTDRIISVGSTAGQVKPLTGGGVYFGMICADIAAETLCRAFEADDLTARSLTNYDKRWKQVLGREIKLGYWSRKFYELLSDRRIDKIIDITKSQGIDTTLLQSDDLQFDWHGAVILRLLRFRTVAGIVQSLVKPVPSGK